MRLRSALLAAGLVSMLAGEARALSLDELIDLPLAPLPGAADLSDPAAFDPLSKGVDYTYSVARSGVYDPSGNRPNPADPATWTVLSYEGTFTFLPAYAYAAEAPANLLLVLTSLREGYYATGGALPPRLLGGYVEATLADDSYGFVRDPGDPVGVISDEEGESFLALRFALLPGESGSFRFQVALRQTLDETLYHFNRGFRVMPTPVPEPATLACVGVALAAMAVAKRPPLGRGRPRCARFALAVAALRRSRAQK